MSADYFSYAKNSHNDYATSTLDASAPADLLRDNSPARNAVKSAMADYTQPFQKGTLEAGLSHQHHYRQRYSLGAGPRRPALVHRLRQNQPLRVPRKRARRLRQLQPRHQEGIAANAIT